MAERLSAKSIDAYEFARTDLGVTQTACNVSPYFYEEDNYVDDMQLAAWEIYTLTGEKEYLVQADYWGTLEPFTPWIEKDTARHYQFYPFVNLGHANIGEIRDRAISEGRLRPCARGRNHRPGVIRVTCSRRRSPSSGVQITMWQPR
ncbi:MAG: glycoside hydrolase family 9 protein [Bacteroidales bacterium]|nr:glycoside hydrolase family 9 protein [Bacteroidales bacterium]